ncbi:MAG: type III pantothenate kinase, partial [Bacteroidaceae bacterium]|nr:type III pantothenate kinase [Bacteroidaceae bacterium]
TCITYEFISETGEYLGGNISPGADMRFLAMHEHTALLPIVQAEGETPLIGHNTETAMRSGVMLGISHEIEGYIRRLREKNPHVLVFLTGGNILNFDTSIKSGIFADELLLLKGLNRILGYNEL